MKENNNSPRLYGIFNSNRHNEELWGKNCFNSAFPTALACYMRDQGNAAVHVCVHTDKAGNAVVKNDDIAIDDVFNARGIPNEELGFHFETGFPPYHDYAGDVDKADLVVKNGDEWLRPFQIKLTVTPDDGTSGMDEKEWGPELVFRPADTSLCILGMYAAVASRAGEIQKLFSPVCSQIQDWDNRVEMLKHKDALIGCAKAFLAEFHGEQKPYILQTIWKTKGKTPHLADDAFDLFVWSDFAIVLATVLQAETERGQKVKRSYRSVIRFAKVMYELARQRETIQIKQIYRGLTFSAQTDKELAMGGRVTRNFLTSPRRTRLLFPPSVLKKIILGGGHEKLSPERRFDQTVYFAAKHYFDDNGS